ncbi:unnamed protein product [Effrenium voratum]|uniref:Small multi-drug export protein n=1 Tax=Effrenium voratum TaxID=2562239 RepID=A0AA36HPZ6_9DINO|nr:unnamed protein product [Effrenium voratum]CAJ1450385.1 unnamed protein product [Effrenium voratum]
MPRLDRPGAVLGAAGAFLLYQHQSLHGWQPGFACGSMDLANPSLQLTNQARLPALGLRPGAESASALRPARLNLKSSWHLVEGGAEPRLRIKRSALVGVLLGLCLGFATAMSSAQALQAAPAAAAAKPHLGVRLAMKMKQSFGIPDWAILMLLSALPLVELRGGVPVGLWMGLAVPQVLLLCIVGNMIPIPLLLAALRSEKINKLLSPLLNRAAQKTEPIGAHDRWVGIAAFVGVPLPGTGAWTGAMVAHLLGMDLFEAVSSVLAGVIVAACIMASLTLAGWFGCAAVVLLGVVALASRWLQLRKG